MKRVYSKLKENLPLILIYLLIFIVLVYTHKNTFLANDDLPYMYFFRGPVRVTSIVQVLRNQLSDYLYINGRIFVHMILQLTLIFDKNLWMIINPLMIIISIILIIKIIKIKSGNSNIVLSTLLGFILYLSIFKYKQIIYWVAGSVNYVWVFTFLILFVYLYYKYGLSKKKIINMLIIFMLCAIHECTMVFTICFVLCNMIYDWCKTKTFNKDYLLYIISFSGALILLLSPANQARLVSDNIWNSLNIFEKLNLSLPIISSDILNILSPYYPLAYIFILSIILLLLKNKNRFSIITISLIIFNMLLIYITHNNWLYFTLVIILVTSEFYSHLKNKDYDLLFLSLSIYAVVYSNSILPTYAAGRPNYYFYMYAIILSIIVFNKYLNNVSKHNIIYLLFTVILGFLLANEVYIYHKIGAYHQTRLKQIQAFIDNPSDTLILQAIPDKFSMYHMDINYPDKTWFNYPYYIQYYKLPENINIIYK